ncbi:methyltransferase domain-containing protein [Okeania sp.]|uniref:methyltransferase domain-containing protein n=1 Tax=Okeania sp. TaxID=3100323 RepID=UPI002B4B32EC|nr:methyltransferase domain-containing protein [Okeania sp.]MEB3343450.1 methyltransferase domain-containing protein [Okeania sp.]
MKSTNLTNYNLEEVKVEVISIHVPRTGGTAFKNVIRQVYSSEEIFFDYPHKGPIRNRMLSKPKPEVKIIHGHFPAPKYNQKFPGSKKIIWLRDPIKRLISLYFFWKSWQILIANDEQSLKNNQEASLSFIEFVEQPEMQNLIKLNFLQNERLKDFYWVGIQDFFAEDLHQLSVMLNWADYELETQKSNPYPEYKLLTKEVLSNQEIVDKISAMNQEDIEIYREALSLRVRRQKTSEIKYYIQNNSGKKNIIQKKGRINCLLTWGSIDRVIVKNQVLRLSGWVASLDAGMVQGFKVSVGNQEFSFFEQTLNIPSPDIEKVHSSLFGAGNARFRLKILLNKQKINQIKHSLISVIPLFEKGEGIVILTALTPILPLPDRKYLKMIGEDSAHQFIYHSFKLLGSLIQRLGLQPTDHILDVGCNVGKVAYCLVHYLEPSGRYEGFDMVENFISWTQREVTTRKPNFNFNWHNIHHRLYNYTGKISANNFIFPYPDVSFNCVCVSRLFTHLQGSGVGHFLDEIYRVLQPGGRCLLICFLVNLEAAELISKGKSSQQFIYEIEDGLTIDINLPEKGIGFRENILLEWVEERGFSVLERAYGSWCGRTSSIKEDLLVLEKSF